MEKSLKRITIYYVNVRGLKSKMEDTLRIIEDINPDIIGLVETHMKREENVEINGYKIIRKDRQREGGGLLIGIKNKFAHLYTELEMTEVNNLDSHGLLLEAKPNRRLD